ncbi:DUF333 domain-containing protein [Parasedimentitalea maritima]|uniref:DUF333 domain-containing protein n=1 Tax=Parasedimentitalea maritima TaxID=2578117 RepID=A0ABY2UNI0_9RHOB|nr:DUF333 domain-containing protein [Zongyanglinia marina]TLP55473.1 DUF333 domain-containing protein [Zongyanglinia marina]
MTYKFPNPLFFHPYLAGFLILLMPTIAAANYSLANPAAVFCIEQGGLYGTQEHDGAVDGFCTLEGGTEVNAWEYFRNSHKEPATMKTTKIANPAASFCVAIGGSYDLKTSVCTLKDGSMVDAWELYREAHENTAKLTNPAADYCLETGGSYEIRNSENGKVGICKKRDGTEVDAWALFRSKTPN